MSKETSWKFPELLQRHTWTAQNNQKKGTNWLTALICEGVFLSQQKALTRIIPTLSKKEETGHPGRHIQTAAKDERVTLNSSLQPPIGMWVALVRVTAQLMNSFDTI